MRLSQQVAEIERRLDERDAHAGAARERITTREQARRACRLVLHDLALPSATTTELMLARYIMDLVGESD